MVGRRFRNTLIELLCRVDLSHQSTNTANTTITTAVVKKGSKTFQAGYGQHHGRSGSKSNQNQNNDQQLQTNNIATKNGTVVL